MKRILHVITSLRMGGAERLVADMLPRLRERGEEVSLLLFDGTRTPIYEELERKGIEIDALGCGAFQMHNPLLVFGLRRHLLRCGCDIVHTHNTPCQLLAALAAPSSGPRMVTTEHNTFNRRRHWRWYDAVDRWMYGCYDHIACVGRQTEQNLVSKLGRAASELDISVVPNGIELARFLSARADVSLRTADEAERKVVAMVSAFRPQKDQPTLIRAMRHLSDDYRLWLVGDGAQRAECERLAAELGVAPRVRFWGVREDIPAIMASADAVVLSSHYEGMSLSSIEGMASGRPFAASDVEGLREVVEGAGELFAEGDDREAARTIRRLCEDSVFAAEVSERCRARAAQYDIERVVDDYERIYERVLQRK